MILEDSTVLHYNYLHVTDSYYVYFKAIVKNHSSRVVKKYVLYFICWLLFDFFLGMPKVVSFICCGDFCFLFLSLYHYSRDLQMDTMLMLRKYLDRLTPSEFHTFLVGGHSTVAGFVFGLFILFGVSVSVDPGEGLAEE